MDPTIEKILRTHVEELVKFNEGTPFYRGGECAEISPIKVRLSNVFLSHTGATTYAYTRHRGQQMPYAYMYRAVASRSITLLCVDRQKDLCEKLQEALHNRLFPITFQREFLIGLYRNIKPEIDGIFYPDGKTSECLIDNQGDVLQVRDYVVFPHDRPDREVIARVLGR